MSYLQKLKKSFKNEDLFTQSLTHKSWVNEHKGERTSNERLEFLGDAVLELIVSEAIYHRLPDKEEGYLTALRASLVNTQNLTEVAKSMNLGEFIFLSKGEEMSGGRDNASLLADTVEAVIGALYLDQGYEACSVFIKDNFLNKLEEKLKTSLKDPKSTLQEYVQNLGFRAPTYKVVKAFGPDHAKQFVVETVVNGEKVAEAEGSSKSEAAQKAADAALTKLKAQ